MKVWGREVAVWVALVSAVVQTGVEFGLHVSPEVQAGFTAVVAAVLGFYVAFATGDGVIAGALGVVQSGVALALAFGLDVNPRLQYVVSGILALAAGIYVRDRVTAPVPASAVSGPMALGKGTG